MPVGVDSRRLAAAPAGGGEIEASAGFSSYSPECRGGAMRQHRIGAARQHGGHSMPVGREQPMPYGVDALVHAVQSPRGDSLSHRSGIQAKSFELLE